MHFTLTAFALAYNHTYATYSQNAEVNRCNGNRVCGSLSSARLLAVGASPNFGCDAFRAPAPSLSAAPFQQLPNDTVHATQLLVSSKQKFPGSSGLSCSGCCSGLGGRLVVLWVPAHRVHGTLGELVSLQISSTSKLAFDCAIPPHVPNIQIGRNC